MSDDITTGPFSVTWMKNNDLVGAVERIDICIAELARSESADSGGAQIFDRQRIDMYNKQIDEYMDYVVSVTGKVDVPHTYPTRYDISYISNTLEHVDITNKAMRDLIRLYLQMMEQLSKSGSASWSNGIEQHDYNRYVMIRDKIQSFLTDYVDVVTPVDMPEYTSFSQEGGAGGQAQSTATAGPLAAGGSPAQA
jgi:hypothetical protein